MPLTRHYPSLLQIIIATSALHMSNASEKFLTTGFSSFNHRNSKDPPHSRVLTTFQSECYSLALTAKQQALTSLSSAISTMSLDDTDVILAIVLLFVQCELIDSGKNNWKHHIRGARSLINMVYRSGCISKAEMSPLRRYLISNCLM